MARDDETADRGNSPLDGWPPDFDHLVIPDDCSELDADARALAREQRAVRRTERLRAVLGVRRWHRYPLAWPVAVAAVAATACLVSLLLTLRPAAREAPRARPLGTAGLRPGQEGGLLPDIQVRRDDGTLAAVRAFRPAVMVLAPAGCDCTALLRTVLRLAAKHHVYPVAIGAQLPAVPVELQRGPLIRAADPGGTLVGDFRVSARPVLLLVRDDGVVNRILADAPPENVLDGEVVVLAS
jgi:hypothetical protein